jgi:hypothetical protein
MKLRRPLKRRLGRSLDKSKLPLSSDLEGPTNPTAQDRGVGKTKMSRKVAVAGAGQCVSSPDGESASSVQIKPR